ncbi:MaoC/PaaZ C-terminal domain-containing protein [Actinophytocola sp.]|uniref:MaoC/PaaZ C-terminal domain-containing protein n=1 Tax=Actinophytocola sp. TaxID=1872138 RepID=UPI003D6B7BBF
MTELCLEDLEVDAEYVSPARTITEADVVNFAGVSGDFNRIHTDAEYCKTTPYGQRVVHGLLGMSVLTGLLYRTGLFDGTTLAMVGISEWHFRAPIFIGDTVHMRLRVTGVRRVSAGDRGIVERWFQLVNQHDTVTQEGAMNAMVRAREFVPAKNGSSDGE